MSHLPGDNIHLRDTVVPVREEDGTTYGVSAFGPVKVLPGGGILPTDIGDLCPGVDLTPVVETTPCFMSRYQDCDGQKANCPTLQSVVLCMKHHQETHGNREYPIKKGNFRCIEPGR